MATGYVRQEAANITSGATIQASHFNNEYNAIVAAFATVSGHTHDGTTGGGAAIDMNGQEFILDADADTSITADTDDQIDIKIAGADDFRMTANTFTALSGSTISVPSGATLDVSGGTLTLANDQISGDKISGGTIGGPVTLVSPVITTSPTAAGSIWTDLGAVTTADINGGTIDGATVGATSATTGRFTTVESTIGTGTAPFIVASTTNVANLNASSLSGATFAAPGAIGGGTPAAGTFTDLTANTSIVPGSDNTVDLGTALVEFKDLYIDGTANIDSLVADTADINAGTIDGVTIGTSSVATEIRVDSLTLNGNTLSSTSGNISLAPVTSSRVIVSVSSAGERIAELINANAVNPVGNTMTFSAVSPDNNSLYFYRFDDSTTTRAIIYSDGDLQNHDNSYGAISDERLKQDIVDANLTNQWDDIKNLKVRKYKFKSDVEAYGQDAVTHIGVVAQELLQTSPGLVVYHEDQDTYSVQYSILYMKAMGALQLALTRIEDLTARVAALEA